MPPGSAALLFVWPIPFTAVTNTSTLRVRVPTAPTLVHLKIENAANGTINYETEVNATQANTWQTLSFNLTSPVVRTPAPWDGSRPAA